VTQPTTASVAGLAYAAVGTAVAYRCFAWAVARRASARLAVALYAAPPLGVIASWRALGERPPLRDLVGGVVILAAVFRGERAGSRTTA
jgi:drug/metabolite transporter (DMT)-like permease